MVASAAGATADNPFVYGEIVTAAAFADRDEERERLARDLAAGQKVFLISPRRYGKSSLVRDVMRGLARKKILTIEVTVAADTRTRSLVMSRSAEGTETTQEFPGWPATRIEVAAPPRGQTVHIEDAWGNGVDVAAP